MGQVSCTGMNGLKQYISFVKEVGAKLGGECAGLGSDTVFLEGASQT